MTGELKVIDV